MNPVHEVGWMIRNTKIRKQLPFPSPEEHSALHRPRASPPLSILQIQGDRFCMRSMKPRHRWECDQYLHCITDSDCVAIRRKLSAYHIYY